MCLRPLLSNNKDSEHNTRHALTSRSCHLTELQTEGVLAFLMQRKRAKMPAVLNPCVKKKCPLKPGLTHHEKTEASFYACFGAKCQKDIPRERNALKCTDNSPVKNCFKG